jgi:hypothetical protein
VDTRFTPEEALARIADVARHQSSLRSRFEGMTWILWGLVTALQAMTLDAIQEAAVADTPAGRHLVGLASHLWILVGIAASVGIWRAAAVSFDPGIDRRRALAFFIAWPVLLATASYVVTGYGGGPARFAVIVALLLLGFALVNPVRFTPRGRWTAAILAIAAGAVALVVEVYGPAGEAWYGVTGSAIGISWVLAGLYALYRG